MSDEIQELDDPPASVSHQGVLRTEVAPQENGTYTNSLGGFIKRKLDDDSSIDRPEDTNTDPKPKIQRVPHALNKSGGIEFFTPKEFSFGPINFKGFIDYTGRRPKLNRCEQWIKFDWAKDFIESTNTTPEELYNRIHQEIDRLKNCFEYEVLEAFEVNHKGVHLELILLIDGCALLHYINCIIQNRFECLNIKPYQAAFLEHDMFLLENQLPFQLLELLVTDKRAWMENFKLFIDDIALISKAGAKADNQDKKKQVSKPNRPQVGDRPTDTNGEGPIRLLDRLRKGFYSLVHKKKQGGEHNRQKDNQQQVGAISIDINDKMPIHLLDLLRKRLFRLISNKEDKKKQVGIWPQNEDHSQEEDNITKEEYVWESYRSVLELKAAGIYFEKNEGSQFLNDICFQDGLIFGSLKIPPLTIYDYAHSLFMNLIAYEMCPDFVNNLEVTSYICFLDVLIDHPEDVKELRKAHIIRNFLGNDEQLAKLFNIIARDLVPNNVLYLPVKRDIQRYYDSYLSPNMAQFYYSHFTSPWTMIAFLGAVGLFVLALLQTIYTVK